MPYPPPRHDKIPSIILTVLLGIAFLIPGRWTIVIFVVFFISNTFLQKEKSGNKNQWLEQLLRKIQNIYNHHTKNGTSDMQTEYDRVVQTEAVTPTQHPFFEQNSNPDTNTYHTSTDTNQSNSPTRQTSFFTSFFSQPMPTIINFSTIFKMIVGFLILLFVRGLISGGFFIVQPGTKAILIRLGSIINQTYDEGLHFKIPYVDMVKTMSIQTQKLQGDGDAASKDLQSVKGDIALNYRLDPSQLITIYQNIGTNEAVENKIIGPMIQEGVKATTAKYTAEELITKRQLVSTDMTDTMKKKLGVYGIIVQDVNIVNFKFSDDFNRSIENKVKAEQEALTEKNKLESIKFQAQQRIESAKAEAESIRIQAEAIKNQGGAEYVNLKWIEKRDGKLPTTQFGGNTPVIYSPSASK